MQVGNIQLMQKQKKFSQNNVHNFRFTGVHLQYYLIPARELKPWSLKSLEIRNVCTNIALVKFKNNIEDTAYIYSPVQYKTYLVQYNTILFRKVQYSNYLVHWYTSQYTVQYSRLHHYSAVAFVLYNTVQNNTVQSIKYRKPKYSSVQYIKFQYITIHLYYSTVQYTVDHYTTCNTSVSTLYLNPLPSKRYKRF